MIDARNYSERIRDFCKKYYAQIIDDSRRCTKMIPPRYQQSYNIEPGNDGRDLYQSMATFETEPMIVIELPKSKLETLVHQENLFFNNVDAVYQRRVFEVWMEDQEYEKHLRNTHPGVQESYEKYKMMLELCRQKPKIIKDLE